MSGKHDVIRKMPLIIIINRSTFSVIYSTINNIKQDGIIWHKLHGQHPELYSVSINISYRICIDFIIVKDQIIPIDVGTHDEVY